MPEHDRKSVLAIIAALPIVILGAACGAERGAAAAQGRRQRVLRPVPGCEGCEAVWERDAAELAPELALAGRDERGERLVRTIKPAPYPGRTDPAHIHIFVLQPGRRDPYWVDDVVFAGEFGVTKQYRKTRGNRGGSGIVQLARRSGVLHARRDIVLLA
uniref:hypothetical protein n=1 Tax=uncultured Sphingomonas sp. TaxID=158754 RepID=UPI0025E05396|nr:hypothetical protein [uncultured Sphingomonas sp.]